MTRPWWMDWFETETDLVEFQEIKLGMIVKHKIAGTQAVVTRLLLFNGDVIPQVTVSIGFDQGDEFTCSFYEIEPLTSKVKA